MKPANVLLDEDDHVYLTDFGITKQLGGASTDTDRVVGTLDYLAPEQIRGDPVDGRTDCYALGCVLYECLAGGPPFRRATEAETLWAHMQEEPAPLRGHPTLDPVLAQGAREGPRGSLRQLRRADRRGRARARPRRAPAAPAPGAARAAPPRPAAPGRRPAAGRGDAGGGPGGPGRRRRGAAPPQANGVAAIEAADAELASFTETQTPPSSLAVGEGAVWALSLQDSTVTRIDLDTQEGRRADHAARRPDRHRSGRRRRLGAAQGDGTSRASTRARAGSPAPSRFRRRLAGDLALPELGLRAGGGRGRRRLGDQPRPHASPGSIPPAAGAWRRSTWTPPRSPPAARACGSSAARTRCRSPRSTRARTASGRPIRLGAQTPVRRSPSAAATCGPRRRARASSGGSSPGRGRSRRRSTWAWA